MNKSESISKLAEALASVQAQLRPAAENANNPFFKSKYADLESVVSVARDLMGANGLSLSQFPGETRHGEDGGLLAELTSILMHDSGEWMEQTLTMPLAKRDPQGYGSAITYARRYAFASILGVVTGDDDAEAAVNRGQGKRQNQRKPAPAAPNGAGPSKDTPEPVKAQDKPKTASVEDARAWLEGEMRNGKTTLDAVSAAATMTGHYNHWNHVANALKGYDWPASAIEKGFNVEPPQAITKAGALTVFDWLMARKEAVNE